MPKSAGALHNILRGEFGERISISSGAIDRKGMHGGFEVTVGGKLVHSKLKMGHGKCQSEQELDAIIAYIEAELARRKPTKAPPPSTPMLS